MKKLRIPLVILLLLSAFGLYGHFARPNWQKELEASPTLILYSLEPRRDLLQKNPHFLKHARAYVLDQAIVKSPEDKQLIMEAIRASTTFSGILQERDSAGCAMMARHAVSTADGSTLISLCYQCAIGNIYGAKNVFSDEEGNFIRVNRAGKPLFDALLKKYHLRISHSDNK